MVYDVGARLKSSCNYFLSWSFISIHYSSFIFQLNLHTSSNYFYVVFLPKKVQFWFVVSVLKDTLLDQGPGPFWVTGVAGVSIFYGWDKINSFFSKGWQEIWLPWNWRNKHFLSHTWLVNQSTSNVKSMVTVDGAEKLWEPIVRASIARVCWKIFFIIVQLFVYLLVKM